MGLAIVTVLVGDTVNAEPGSRQWMSLLEKSKNNNSIWYKNEFDFEIWVHKFSLD